MTRQIAWAGVLGSTYLFLFAPILAVVAASFNAKSILSFPPRDFTLHWYSIISPSFWEALKVSLVVASSAMVISTILGTIGALALVRGRFKGREALNVFCLSPLMVPTLVIGIALYQFTAVIWQSTGVTLDRTILGLVLGHLTFTIPFVIRAVVASHARFDPSLEEAAYNLGARPIEAFFKVTLPVLKPGIVSGAIFAFLMSLDDVPVALFLGGGDATTLPVMIFTAIEFDLRGDVMAVSSLVVLVSAAVMILLDRTVRLEAVFNTKSN